MATDELPPSREVSGRDVPAAEDYRPLRRITDLPVLSSLEGAADIVQIVVEDAEGARHKVKLSDIITKRDVFLLNMTDGLLESLGQPSGDLTDLASRLAYLLSFKDT